MIEYEKIKEAQEQNYHHGCRRYSELVDRKRKSICNSKRSSSSSSNSSTSHCNNNQRLYLQESMLPNVTNIKHLNNADHKTNNTTNNISKIINMQNMNYYVDNDGSSRNGSRVSNIQENKQYSDEEADGVEGEEEGNYQSDNNEIQIWICGEPRFISGISSSTTCNDIIQALIDDEVFSHDGDNNNGDGDCCSDDGATNIIRAVNSKNFHCSSKTSTPRQKTISNKGKAMATTAKNVTVISTAAPPVSLMLPTSQPSRDLNDYVITERWRDVEQALSGETLFLPIWTAWGNARNEVKFKLKINKQKTETDKNKSIQEMPKKHHKSKRKMLSNVLHRLIQQSEAVHNHFITINKKKSTNKSTWTSSINCSSTPQITATTTTVAANKSIYEPPITQQLLTQFSDSLKLNVEQPIKVISSDRSKKPIDKELFMSIDIETGSTKSYSYSDDQNSHLEIEYRQFFLNKLLNEKIHQAKILQNSTPIKLEKINSNYETPKRKLRTKENVHQLKFHMISNNNNQLKQSNSIVDNNCINDDYDSGTEHSIIVTDHFNNAYDTNENDDIDTEEINLEIASHISELKRLWQYEEDIMGNLSTIYKLYRAQNQIYREINHQHESMCIDEVQRKLEIYTNQIVEMEFELFQVKLEISQRYDGLENCGQLLKSHLNSTINKTTKYSSLMRKKKDVKKKTDILMKNESSIEYFDDNNKTMIL